MAPRRDVRDKLVLTYDNTKLTDGAGAQLQRIYGIYAVARLLGASYLHTPLRRVDYQGLAALERNVTDPDFHGTLNDLFRIDSDVLPADDLHRVELGNISMEDVDRLVAEFDAGATGGRPTLAQLVVSYGIADQVPDCYGVCKAISPFRSTAAAGRPLRVALHVRRGELLLVQSGRMLPNAYYVNTARHVAAMLDARGIPYQLELHTEVAGATFTVPPGYPGLPGDVASAVISPEMSPLHEFDALPHLVRHINDPAIDCVRKLATADVLVMSRSSFSYVAAILNRRGIVLYHPFWHSALSSWLTVDPEGRVDPERFGQALDTLLEPLSPGG